MTTLPPHSSTNRINHKRLGFVRRPLRYSRTVESPTPMRRAASALLSPARCSNCSRSRAMTRRSQITGVRGDGPIIADRYGEQLMVGTSEPLVGSAEAEGMTPGAITVASDIERPLYHARYLESKRKASRMTHHLPRQLTRCHNLNFACGIAPAFLCASDPPPLACGRRIQA